MSTPTTTQYDDLQSRLRDPSQFFAGLAELARGMFEVTRNGSIPQTTISLMQLRAGQIVGNTYHTIRQTGDLRHAGGAEERITSVASWQDSPYFSDAERVALELVEAILTPSAFGERVSDQLFDEIALHYDEKALWTLVLAISQIFFFIPVALVAKPIPGREQHYST